MVNYKPLIVYQSGLLPYPQDWPKRYNACNEACDMLLGPCACGAYHNEEEDWVKKALEENDAYLERKG
jgi:hypothetical protein